MGPEKSYVKNIRLEESLTCNVCDRYFPTARQLAQHQQKKRHFGCSACDNLFPSLMALEHHKEELEHWSEELTDEGSEGRRRRERECSDEEERDEDALSEEHERLLL
ncbi:hypothetical protein J437_LFUL014783 [Ladona fulva]|uniref:C2H2-type domain-containing protein n=1 Tax=Ladona fulva TaxID=123851 RepID=A0A8K0KII6_LADFU|nr:hypothetical protein J437_LFUL014783 [Ladona fulva]